MNKYSVRANEVCSNHFMAPKFRGPERDILCQYGEAIQLSNLALQSPAYQFRRAIVDDVRSFENTMDEKKELRISVFMSTREIYFKLSQVGSADSGYIKFFGEDDEGTPVNLSMHFTLVQYQLHEVATDNPTRIGFSLK